MDIKDLFNTWSASVDFKDRQWLLSKWENIDGIVWPEEKIDIMIQSIKDRLECQRDHYLLDLGCGGGWITSYFKPLVAKVAGVDFSDEMLKKALKGYPDIPFVCAEIGRLPFDQGIFDRVLCQFVFINIVEDKDIKQALSDIVRILKKGGIAFVGQLPDETKSALYDREKASYLEYCRQNFSLGKNFTDKCRIPLKLFSKKTVAKWINRLNVSFRFEDSFNPFYRQGQKEFIDWRFDIILKK